MENLLCLVRNPKGRFSVALFFPQKAALKSPPFRPFLDAPNTGTFTMYVTELLHGADP